MCGRTHVALLQTIPYAIGQFTDILYCNTYL